MNTPAITIEPHKENHFDFEMAVSGLTATNAEARFVLKANPDMNMIFPCEHRGDNKWKVTLPPMPDLETGVRDFWIEVIIDGHHFKPLEGTLGVMGETKPIEKVDVTVDEIGNTVVDKPEVTVHNVEKDAAKIQKVQEAIEFAKLPAIPKPVQPKRKRIQAKKTPAKKPEPIVTESEADKIVREAIKQVDEKEVFANIPSGTERCKDCNGSGHSSGRAGATVWDHDKDVCKACKGKGYRSPDAKHPALKEKHEIVVIDEPHHIKKEKIDPVKDASVKNALKGLEPVKQPKKKVKVKKGKRVTR